VTTVRTCRRCGSVLPEAASTRRVWCSTRCRNAAAEMRSRTDRDAAFALLRRLVSGIRTGADVAPLVAEAADLLRARP
jgi:hypothetical protein